MGEIQKRGGAPKTFRVQGRNLPFDALATACDIDTRNPRQTRILGTALKEIRQFYYEEVEALGIPEGLTPEDWERSLAAAIESRAQAYRVRFRSVELTPVALAKWWHQLARPRRSPERLSGADIRRGAQ